MDIDIVKLAQINNAFCKFQCGTLLFTPWSFVMELVEQHDNNRNTQKNEIKVSSKATKKKTNTSRYKEERRERMGKERKKGRKKGENNLTYLTLLEMQDTPPPSPPQVSIRLLLLELEVSQQWKQQEW